MARMVDISEKEVSLRTAAAQGDINLRPVTINAIRNKEIKKGDVLNTAQTAAILAVKNTPNLLPLCHPIPISSIEVSFDIGERTVSCKCIVKARYSTGVEMESLVGTSTALLTIWDMVKYLEKDDEGQYPETCIGAMKVISKSKKG